MALSTICTAPLSFLCERIKVQFYNLFKIYSTADHFRAKRTTIDLTVVDKMFVFERDNVLLRARTEERSQFFEMFLSCFGI